MAVGKPVGNVRPIILYDHLPGILAGYPAVLFLFLTLLSLPKEFDWNWAPNRHMLFWIGLSVMIVWYVAFQFNIPKRKFWLLFGLFGTFIGIPVVLEITTAKFRPFTWTANQLGKLAPEVNSGAFFVLTMVFFLIWLGHYIWSRTHLRVRIDESGLTLNQLGGKGERFELIGLKTENEPLDYLELFIAGAGSLSLKTRMNKPIFKMNRVIGLYRTPLFLFLLRGKLSRIDEMLKFQGGQFATSGQQASDMIDRIEATTEDFDGAVEDETAAGHFDDRDSHKDEREEFR
jgi:hypothetical protein